MEEEFEILADGEEEFEVLPSGAGAPNIARDGLDSVINDYDPSTMELAVARPMRGIYRALDGTANMLLTDPINSLGRAAGLNKDLLERDPFSSARRSVVDVRNAVTGEDNVDLLDAVGEPETAAGRALEGVGEGVGAMIPATGAAKVATAGGEVANFVGKTIYNFADDILRTTAAAPVATGAIEGVAAGGASVGGDIAEAMTGSDDPVVQFTGEILGALTAGVSATGTAKGAVKLAHKTPGLGIPLQALEPFLPSGGRRIASQRMVSLAGGEDAAGAVARRVLDNPDMSPAQASGNDRLMALEKTILKQSGELEDEYARRTKDAVQWARSQIEQSTIGADPQDAATAFQGQIDYLKNLVDINNEQALAKAAQSAAKLTPDRASTPNSELARRELELAYDSAKLQGRELWSQVDDGAVVTTDDIRGVWAQLNDTATAANRVKLPSEARRILSEWDEADTTPTAEEVFGFYSAMRDAARDAIKYPRHDAEAHKMATQMAEAALKDLGATGDVPTEVGSAINVARAYTRDMKETYENGLVGKILGNTQTGADAVERGMTLEGLSGGGSKGSVTLERIREALTNADGERAGDEYIDDFIMGMFAKAAVKEGEGVNQAAAKNFMRRNAELLDQVPAVRDRIKAEMADIDETQRVAKEVSDTVAERTDPRQNASAAFAGAKTNREFEAILGQRDAAAAARQVMKDAQDIGEDAVAGVRASFTDYLVRTSRNRDFDDGSGLSGYDMRETLTDPRKREAAIEIMGEEEFARIEEVVNDLQSLNKSMKAGELSDGVMGAANLGQNIVGVLSRVLGARVGRAVSQGKDIQTPGLFASKMQDWVSSITSNKAEKILKDAQTDPELYAALLMDPYNPIQASKMVERFTRAMTGGAAESALDEDDDDLGGSQGDDDFTMDTSGLPKLAQKIIGAESGGKANAKNSRSSATGVAQYIESTWMSSVRKHAPELLRGRSKGQVLKLRKDPEIATKILLADIEDYSATLKSVRAKVTPGNQYLVHFAGAGGAKAILRAPGNKPLKKILSKKAMDANPFLKGKDARWIRAWAARKMA